MRFLVIAIVISMSYIIPAKASSYWECLNDSCDNGIAIDTQEFEEDEDDPAHDTFWNRTKKGTTKVWHEDGSQTIIRRQPDNSTWIYDSEGSLTIIEED